MVRQYNEEMNSTRPREYDGSHITFGGMNPAITLREHQKSAIAHVLYGGNKMCIRDRPELMNLFKEVADIKTADQLNLPTPEVAVSYTHLDVYKRQNMMSLTSEYS